jgi:hypothetical protein
MHINTPPPSFWAGKTDDASAVSFHIPCNYATMRPLLVRPSRPCRTGPALVWRAHLPSGPSEMLEEVFFYWSTLYIEFVRYDTHLLL